MRKLTIAPTLGLMGASSLPAQPADVDTLDWQKALLDTSAAQRSMNQFCNSTHARQQVIERHDVQVLVAPQGVVHAEGDLPNLTGEVTAIINSLN